MSLNEHLIKVSSEVIEVGRYLVQTQSRLAKAEERIAALEQEVRSFSETMHLLSNPANAADVLRAIAEVNAGRMVEHRIIEAPLLD